MDYKPLISSKPIEIADILVCKAQAEAYDIQTNEFIGSYNMKNFVLLTEHPEIYSSQRFIQEAQNLNLQTEIKNPYHQTVSINQNETKTLDDTLVFHRTTGLRFENYDLNYSTHLKNSNAHVFNPVSSFLNLRDKDMQAIYLKQNGVESIPSFLFRDRPPHNILSQIKESLGEFLVDESYILKATRGNQGIGVNLVQGDNSLLSFLETFWAIQDQKFMIQPYLKGGDEYRILISNNKILGCLKRTPGESDFRSNSNRGNATRILEKDIPQKISELAYNTYRCSNSLYAGIDILSWKDHQFVIEINLVPGFKQMEELNDINFAKEILQDALSRSSGHV